MCVELADDLGRVSRAELWPDSQADDIDVADLADGVLVEQVPDLAEVGGIDAVQLAHEGRAHAARSALLVVAERAHARDHHVVDLVLARGIEDEGLLEAGRQGHAQLSRGDLGLDLAATASDDRLVGSSVRDDVRGQATSCGPGDGPERVCGDDPLTSLESNA